MQSSLTFRPATLADADVVCDVYLASRKRFLPFALSAHSDDEARQWMRELVIPKGGVTVAILDGMIVGMMTLSKGEAHGWIDQLYLHPDAVNKGIGTQLLLHAKSKLGSPIRLYTFQANTGARRFTSGTVSLPSSLAMAPQMKRIVPMFFMSGDQSERSPTWTPGFY